MTLAMSATFRRLYWGLVDVRIGKQKQIFFNYQSISGEPMNIDDPDAVVFDRRANRNAAIRWGALVIGFLSFSVGLGIAAITLAARDPSVAVIPDYYQRALDWDETQRIRQESEALGWEVRQGIGFGGDLNLVVVDKQKQPVAIDRGTFVAFHHARANDLHQARITASSEGTINIPSLIRRAGLWQFELDLVDQQGQRFVKSWQQNILPAERVDSDRKPGKGGSR